MSIGSNADLLNKCFILIEDIDLFSYTFDRAVIAPDTSSLSGFQGTHFSGIFNGGGHVIRNLTIHNPDSYDAGLFGFFGFGGQICDLGVENVDIIGNENIGGLCGYNRDGTIRQTYVTGIISGRYFVGGLCGYHYSGIINKSYTNCDVSGFNRIGGLCGVVCDGLVSQTYATGLVRGGGGYVGGLCGSHLSMCAIIDSYWDIESTSRSYSAGGWGLTSSEMKHAANFVGWNDGNWKIDEGNDSPRLSWENRSGNLITTDYIPPTYAGNGTKEEPYRIVQGTDLISLSRRTRDWSRHFIMMNNIDMGGFNFSQAVIAGGGGVFTGVFDGCGYSLANMTIVSSAQDFVGVFSRIGPGSQVVNLGLENVDITGHDGVGGLCGDNRYGTIDHCYTTGEVHGAYSVGGLCGILNRGVIHQSYTNGTTSGGRIVGGVCGWSNGTIHLTYATGSVIGDNRVGGLCGNNSGSICQSNAFVQIYSSDDYVGGLCGRNDSGIIDGSYAAGSVISNGNCVGGLCGMNDDGTISQSYAAGPVSSNGDYTGGLCGWNEGIVYRSYTTGPVSSNGDYTGGLCGWNHIGTINQSYAIGQVGSAGEYTGGLCGWNQGIISNNYTNGLVVGTGYVGGLCGCQYGTKSIIENSYSNGPVYGNSNAGGFLGYHFSGTVADCLWDIQSSQMSDGVGNLEPDPDDVKGFKTTAMMTRPTFTDAGWDFVGEDINGTEDIWTICEGTNYPRFVWQVPKGDFVCPDGVGIEDADAFGECWLAQVDLDTELEDDGDAVVSLAELAQIGQYWLAVGCGDCGGMDLTGDGEVTMEDLSAVAGDWLEAVYPECGMADLDGDDFVDLADWAVFAAGWMEGE
jgi:hypothetical protein